MVFFWDYILINFKIFSIINMVKINERIMVYVII